MESYKRTVHYYETDQMGITHHSNYVRWMEEARIYFLAQIGWSLDWWENRGIVSPVTALECRYKVTTTFPDEISIRVMVLECKGVKLKLGYEMRKADGTVAFEAITEHCFMERGGRIVRLKKEFPEFYQKLLMLMESAC